MVEANTPPWTSGLALPTGAHSVRRPATTFKVRRRGLSPKRQAEFDEWIEHHGLDVDGPPIDALGVFGRDVPLVLDVGFGHGVGRGVSGSTRCFHLRVFPSRRAVTFGSHGSGRSSLPS